MAGGHKQKPCPGGCGTMIRTYRQRCIKCRGTQALRQAGAEAAAAGPAESVEVSGDGSRQTIERLVSDDVRTLEDLIRVCQIDTEQWEVERWIANKWAVGAKDAADVLQVRPLFQVKAWLRRKNGLTLTLERLQAALVEDIRAELRTFSAPEPRHAFAEGGYLFEFAPFDLHVGKYAWAEETVTHYDTEIAADLFRASLGFLLDRALRLTGGKLERVLAVLGNDVAHVDSKRGQTTAGTPMDVDTRYIRVYRRICEIHRWAVDQLRQVAPVDIVIVPGNHDELTSFHLGEILAARYDGDPHVTVNNSARLRKYYEFGCNLLGFTHGDAEKVAELPLLMAREVPDQWARASSREWHIGHKHIAERFSWRQQDLHSDKGVRVRRLPSLSAHDAWHTKHGYTDRRACEGFVFHRAAGFTGQLSFNVDHFTGRAAGL